MAVTTVGLAIASLAVTAVGTAYQIKQSQSAQAQQKKQFNESQALQKEGAAKQQQLADLQTVRAKRQAVREAQIRRADITNAAEQTGGAGSSSLSGATGSVVTQASSAVSFLDTANQLHSQASTLFGEASEVANRPIQVSPIAAGLTSFSSQIFNNSDKIANAYNNVFGPSKP